MSETLAFLSAAELAARYAVRTLSPVEVTRAMLERIERLNPCLNAYCLVDAEAALAQAHASEARWMRGEPASSIDGVPTAIKDLVLTRGWPTLRGSKTIDPAGPWADDAPATARLREAGAVLLGKTCTPEVGWKGVTDSPLTGITRNPWDPTRTPGGSSGGASAALAAGLCTLAIGTDGGGSIRIPCAFTALSGIKPNFGRVPAWPLSPMGTVAHLGPMARSIEDCARLLTYIARPDDRDWFALPGEPIDWSARIDGGVRGLRIAYSARLGYVSTIDPEVEASVRSAAEQFAALGAHVEAVDPGFADCRPAFSVLWMSGAFNALKHLSPERAELLEPALRAAVAKGASTSLAEYLDATNERMRLAERMRAFHRDWDLLITPSLPIAAFEVGRIAPAGGDDADWTWWTPFSFPFNLTQQPAASIPCGFSRAGLPIGVQIVAANFREDLVLRAAHAFQQATDYHRRHPEL